jgi:hypothetical protein
MADQIKFNIDNSSIREMQAEIKRLKSEISSATDPEDMRRLSIEAGQIRDRMDEVNQQVKIYATDSPFAQSQQQLKGVGSALSNLDFAKAAERAKALATNVQAISFKQATAGLKDLGTTFAQLGKSLLTNPLFLIGAAIALLVVGIVKLLDKMGVLKTISEGVAKVFEWLNGIIEGIVQTFQWLSDTLFGTSLQAEALAKKQAELADKELENIKKVAAEKENALNREIKLAKALGQDVEQLEREKRKEILKTAQLEFDNLNQKLNNRAFLKNLTKEEIDDLKEQFREAKNILLDAKNELKVFEAETATEKEAARTKDAAKEESDRKARIAAQKAYNKTRLEVERELIDLRNTQIADDETRERTQLEERYKRLLEDTKNNEKFTSAEKSKLKLELERKLQLELDKLAKGFEDKRQADEKQKEADERQKQDERLNLIKQYDQLSLQLMQEGEDRDNLIRQQQYDAQIEQLEKFLEKGIITKEEFAEKEKEVEQRLKDDLSDINQKYRDQEAQAEKELKELMVNIAWDSVNSLIALGEAFGEDNEKLAKAAFDTQKAAGIAETIINTYKSAQAAYASLAGIPVIGPALGAAAAGAAIVAGIANVKKISNQKFQGGGVSSGGNPSRPATTSVSSASSASTTPRLDLFGTSNVRNEVSAGRTQNIETTVSVVEINNVQNRVSEIERRSTL